MARCGLQVHHMGDMGLSMGERPCKGGLAGTSAGTRSCKREVRRYGTEGYKGDCKGGWSDKERSMGANRNHLDTE